MRHASLPSFEGPFRDNVTEFLRLCGHKVPLDHTKYHDRVSAWVIKLDAERGGSGAYLHVYEEKLTGEDGSEASISCDNCRNMGTCFILKLDERLKPDLSLLILADISLSS